MASTPIDDPANDAPPTALTERVALARPNALSTFRFPADRHSGDAPRWFSTAPGSHPVRQGNEVRYLIDGPATFAEMARSMGAATDPAAHFIYILGWDIELDFPFAADGSTVKSVLQQASDVRGIQVRALIWDGMVHSPLFPFAIDSSAGVDFIDGLKNGQAFQDERTLPKGSHHQKVVIVNGSEGLVAFCGGIDIDPNRAFPKNVNGSNFQGAPFHDVHCRLRGPVAWDVLQTFIERWADYIRASQPIVGPSHERGALLGRNVTFESQPKPGRLQVQVAKTYGNATAHGMTIQHSDVDRKSTPYQFAPTGETTLAAMFFRAIEAARRFIYIEDQYLVHLEVSNALAAAVGRLAHITMLIPHSDLADLPHIWERRRLFLEPLRKAGGKKVRVFFRSPQGEFVPHSYVHAKTWIFDDEFAIIGTANVNRRSFTHDSEIDVGIFDESTNDRESYMFAHRLRIKLWAEHLNMDTPDGHAKLADGVASAVHWPLPDSNIAAGAKVALYDENEKQDPSSLSNLASWDDVDPEGR